jgi:hypothetical protein
LERALRQTVSRSAGIEGTALRSGVAEARGELRLAEESLDVGLLASLLDVDLLERDLSAELRVPGAPDDAHAAVADLPEEAIPAERPTRDVARVGRGCWKARREGGHGRLGQGRR